MPTCSRPHRARRAACPHAAACTAPRGGAHLCARLRRASRCVGSGTILRFAEYIVPYGPAVIPPCHSERSRRIRTPVFVLTRTRIPSRTTLLPTPLSAGAFFHPKIRKNIEYHSNICYSITINGLPYIQTGTCRKPSYRRFLAYLPRMYRLPAIWSFPKPDSRKGDAA